MKRLLTCILLVGILGIPQRANTQLPNSPDPRRTPEQKTGFSSHTIHAMVKESERVFYGEIVKKEYTAREDMGMWVTTDFTVKVIDNIKGTKNSVDKDHAIFFVFGGIRKDNITGEELELIIPSSGPFKLPKFVKGMKVFMFLVKAAYLGEIGLDGKPIRMPFDGLVIGRGGYIRVDGDRVHFPYFFTKPITLPDGKPDKLLTMNYIAIPIQLFIKMAKASIIDKDAIKAIDEQLGTRAKNLRKVHPFPRPKVADIILEAEEIDRIEKIVDAILESARPDRLDR